MGIFDRLFGKRKGGIPPTKAALPTKSLGKQSTSSDSGGAPDPMIVSPSVSTTLNKTNQPAGEVATEPLGNGSPHNFDDRTQAILITKKSLQEAHCNKCGKQPGPNAFILLDSGNEFFFCPNCGRFFCPTCYSDVLPLTNGTSGFGLCTHCDCEVQKAIPGDSGKRPFKSLPISNGAGKERAAYSTDELHSLVDDFLKNYNGR